jgi:site-specific recombinase XerD
MVLDLSRFDDYLRKRGLLLNTRRAYVGVLQNAGADPVEWYAELLGSRPPIGTVQQARAAVAHWLRMEGADVLTIRSKLAPAKGRKSAEKRGLSPGALAAYLAAASERAEPVRTILLLLPRTGLRIAELCALTRSNLVEHENRLILSFHGKGDKHRFVPLGSEGEQVMRAWLAQREQHGEILPDMPLFPGRGGPLVPWTAQEACREIRQEVPGLAGLTPHILRHTYATNVVVSGVDLAQLKAILGHTDIKTTQRYLHPSVDDLAASIGTIKGL